jgi:ABC-type transport system substrate-binding protein
MQSYWDKVLSRRLTRRRALVGSSALTASAAFLVACGGDDEDAPSPSTGATGGGATGATGGGGSTGATGATGGGSTGATGSTGGSAQSGLIYNPENTTAQAKHGGTYITTQDNAFAIAPDPHKIGAHGRVGSSVYSQLFRIKHGVLQNTDGEIMGDLAQSWELSPDQLKITIKLEPEAGFSPVAPTNGRIIDSEDVTFSWRRMIDSGAQLRGDLANEVSPAAPILSIEAPDSSTVVINLASPNSTIYTLLAHSGLGSFWIVPKEAGNAGVDIANNPAGTGPYYITELLPETRVVYKKNPHFKRSTLKNNEPYIEEIQTPIILEAATRSAQFRAGQVHETSFPRLEMVGAKKDQPELLMFAIEPPAGTERVYFGHNADSPFIDERLRKAFYKLIDRDAYVTAAYDVDFFADDGLEVGQFWEGSFKRASWSGWVLDQKSTEDYGALQANFNFDAEEAKKLVEAAGQDIPFNFVWARSAPGPTSFSQPIYDRMQIIEGMIRDSGVMNFEFNDLEWATEWVPQVRASGGKFTGTSWGPDTSTLDPSAAAFFVYHPSGGYFEGGDDTLTELAEKIRSEFDVETRKALVKEIQLYDAEHMFNQKLGVAAGFALAWPMVKNVGVFRGGTNWQDINSAGQGGELKGWLDPSLPPGA